MKVLIIGGVAGGASTGARLRRLDESAEIIIFERGKDVSFANCGIPYFCGDVIKDRDRLVVQSPESLKELLNLDVRINSEVLSIDRTNKKITVLDIKNNKKYEENYDKLVLSPGAYPFKPKIEGIENEKIFTVRNLDDMDKIKNFAKSGAKSVGIVGAGFIGVEVAENLSHLGLETTIIEASNQILAPIDLEMAYQVQNHLIDKGVELLLNDGVKKFTEEDKKIKIILNSSADVKVDFVVFCIGVKPEINLAKDCNLQIGETGGIFVNENLQTSDLDIYALGDAIEVKDLVSKKPVLIPLAGPANKQGRIVAENIVGIDSKYKYSQGTSILKVFDMIVGATGNNEKFLKRNNIPYQKSFSWSFSHSDYYPSAFLLLIKILFSPNDGKILGAQAVGMDGVDKRIDVIATAIKFEKTIFDLKDLELCYAPPFGSAKDPVNIAGMVAENILTKKLNPVFVDEVELWQNDSEKIILDVRTLPERHIGFIENSINIPIKELRGRISEIPKDKKILIYCNKGMNSYFASRILMQKEGFLAENIYSLMGGYLLYKQKFQIIKKNFKNNELKKEDIVWDKIIKIDACGLQCPGPIMKLSKSISEINIGDVVEISTTDQGFKNDVYNWAKSSENTVIDVKEENKIIKAFVKKGIENNLYNGKIDSINENKNNKTIVVFSNDLDKALASFVIANGALATGRKVTLFFTFWGLNVLRKEENMNEKVSKGFIDKMFGMMMPKGINKLSLSKMNMFGLGTFMMKYVMKKKNILTLQELIKQAKDNGARFIACQMSMDVMGIKKEELIEGVEIGGVATYINDAENSDMNLFI